MGQLARGTWGYKPSEGMPPVPATMGNPVICYALRDLTRYLQFRNKVADWSLKLSPHHVYFQVFNIT